MSRMLILLIIYDLKLIASDCPCVPAFSKEKSKPFQICGWQINEGGGSGCNDNDIYEGCENKNTTEPAKIATSCPNKCFHKSDKVLACGLCGKWGPNGLCTNIQKISTKKQKTTKKNKNRPKSILKPEIKTRSNTYSNVMYDNGGIMSDDHNYKCQLSWESDIQIELVFVQDGRTDYNTATDKVDSFLRILQKNMQSIVEVLSQTFSIRLGVTSFIDWPERTNCEEDYCYNLNCKLNDWDKVNLGSCIRDIEQGVGVDRPQSSLTALYYTALDLKMGWSKGLYTSEGKRIIKVMVILTNGPWISHEWLQEEDPLKKFPLPQGQGTDNCKSGPPKISMLKNVMQDFFLIGLIGDEIWIHDWKKYITQLDAITNSFLSVVSISKNRERDIDRISAILINAIKIMTCQTFQPQPFNIQGI